MIETLLRALDLRTGRFTSPHLERMSERISIDGEPLDDEAFVRAFNDVAAYTHLVDAEQEHPLSFFETIVGMAYAAFADAPGRRRRRRGRDGRRLGRDQRRRRRRRRRAADRGRPREVPRRRRRPRSRSRRPGSSSPARSPCSPSRPPRSPPCCSSGPPRSARPSPARAWSSASSPARPPSAARSSRSRASARGTTTCSCRSTAPTRPRTPPSPSPRSSRSAPATLDEDLVRAAFAEVTSPGRLEIIRRSPTIVLDAAHNPHGAEALAAALEDSFAFSPLVGRDRRDGGQGPRGRARRPRAAPRLRRLHPELDPALDVRRRPRPRRRRDLRRGPGQRRARPRRGHRPRRHPRRGGGGHRASSIGSGAVLVTGSVVTVGEARAMLKGRR